MNMGNVWKKLIIEAEPMFEIIVNQNYGMMGADWHININFFILI